MFIDLKETVGLLTISLILLCAVCYAQTPLRDSAAWNRQWLRVDSLVNEKSDKAALVLDSLKPYLPQTISLQSKWFEKRLGAVFATQPYIAAEPYLENFLDISRASGDSDNVAFCMARLGHIYYLRKQYADALSYELYALKLAQQSSTIEPAKKSGIFASLVNLYLDLEDYEKSFQLADSCLQIRLTAVNTPPSLTQAYHFLGESAKGLGKTTESRAYFEKGLSLPPNGYTTLIHRGMGDLALFENELEQAEQFYQKALKNFNQFNKSELRPIPKLELLKRLGSVYLQMNKPSEAGLYLSEALQLASDKKVGAGATYELNRLMGKYFELTSQPEKALVYYNIYMLQADTVMQEKLNKRLLNLQTRFATEEKEKAILYLDQLSKRRNQQINFLITGSALLALFAAGIGWLLYQRKQNMKRLQAKHDQSEKLLIEKTELLKQLENTQEHLVQSEKLASLGELTAGIAHEMNNPINFISTNTYALKADLEDLQSMLPPASSESTAPWQPLMEEINALMDGIRRGCDRSTAIINGLRLFARRGSGEITPANLHTGIDTCLTILAGKMEGRITIEKQYGNLPPVPCHFDAINQVLMNLLSNGVDELLESDAATPAIKIETSLKGNYASVSIGDNGRGMPPEVKARIFEPFFTTKEAGKGTGLGLAISYGIVQQHGGRIEVKSQPGSGTVFELFLPLTQPLKSV